MSNTKKHPLTIVLENIRSALNVGAMFRTADAASISKMFLTGITPYPPHKRIPKTALGAIEMVDWEYKNDTFDVLNQLKKQGNKIISVEPSKNAQNYWDYKFDKPSTLIFGNEITGVSEKVLDYSDAVVYIPMFGKKESLNVATTFGVMVYEVIRQWTWHN
jgi:tRNA G18 (ribose-2'-O)-methylase SpoU